MSRLHHVLGASVLLATTITGLSASSAAASVIPKSFEERQSLPYRCTVLDDLVQVPETPAGEVVSRSWIDYVGTTFPDGASGHATVVGLNRALELADVAAASYAGTWRWHAAPADAPAIEDDASFSGIVTPSGGSAIGRIDFGVRPPAGTLGVGTNVASVDGLSFVIRGTTATGEAADFGDTPDGDNDPSTLTVTCSGPRTRISTVVRAPTPPWPGPSFEELTPAATSVTIRLASVSGAAGISVRLSDGQTKQIPATGTVTFDGLRPSTPYTVTAQSLRPEGSSVPTSRTFTTLAVPARISLRGPGRLTVSGPTTGTVAPWASVRGELDPATGAFTGTTAIDPATGTTTSLGVLPIRATFGFTAVGPTTGTSTDAGFSLTTQQDVALTKATLFGVPIATGSCHTATAPTIALSSTTPGATLRTGGTASATFSLGRLTGCSTFGSLFGTAGGRATLQVQLAPYPVQPPMPPTT